MEAAPTNFAHVYIYNHAHNILNVLLIYSHDYKWHLGRKGFLVHVYGF